MTMPFHVRWRLLVRHLGTAVMLLLTVCCCCQLQAQQHKEYTRSDFNAALSRVRENHVGAVEEIEAHGDKTLVWLLDAINDHRPMPNGFTVKNRSKNAFEDVAMYQPERLGDAVRLILTRLTGYDDRVDINEPLPIRQRVRAIKAWRTWYQQHREHLRWNPKKHFYTWKEPKKNTKKVKETSRKQV